MDTPVLPQFPYSKMVTDEVIEEKYFEVFLLLAIYLREDELYSKVFP